MFNFSFPSLDRQISVKTLSRLFTALYIISIVPMLVLGFYDFPSADDFSMALQPHQHYVATGNILGTIAAAFSKAYFIYTHYEGYYFSSLLTCLSPGVYGEKWYFLVPFIILGMLTFGVCYFFNALFVKVFKTDKNLANIVSMITLMMMIHCLRGGENRVEAFYWYSGAVNYTFTFGMGFFWLGLLMRIVYDDNEKVQKRRLIWAAIWGFCLGGANYMTALELAICSFLVLVLLIFTKTVTNTVTEEQILTKSVSDMAKSGRKKISFSFDLTVLNDKQIKALKRLWIPACLNIIGFAFSCFAPGNAFRTEETAQNNPVKAILLSLYSTFDVLINSMLRWEVLVGMVLLIPIFWKMAGMIKQRFNHPFIFAVFAYAMVSSNATPPYYAVSNLASGRLRTLAWMEFVVVMCLVIFYFTTWMRQIWECGNSVFQGLEMSAHERKDAIRGGDNVERDSNCEIIRETTVFSNNSSLIICMCMLVIAFGSAMCIVPEPHYYTVSSAVYDLVTGNAAVYRKENDERLKVLMDSSTSEVTLNPYSVRPDMLFYMDITDNPDEWINTATATYYNKEKVYLTE